MGGSGPSANPIPARFWSSGIPPLLPGTLTVLSVAGVGGDREGASELANQEW
jgi:hypothetical protein